MYLLSIFPLRDCLVGKLFCLNLWKILRWCGTVSRVDKLFQWTKTTSIHISITFLDKIGNFQISNFYKTCFFILVGWMVNKKTHLFVYDKKFSKWKFQEKKERFWHSTSVVEIFRKILWNFFKKIISKYFYGVNNENSVSVEYSINKNKYSLKYPEKGSKTLAQEPSEHEFEYEFGEDDFSIHIQIHISLQNDLLTKSPFFQKFTTHEKMLFFWKNTVLSNFTLFENIKKMDFSKHLHSSCKTEKHRKLHLSTFQKEKNSLAKCFLNKKAQCGRNTPSPATSQRTPLREPVKSGHIQKKIQKKTNRAFKLLLFVGAAAFGLFAASFRGLWPLAFFATRRATLFFSRFFLFVCFFWKERGLWAPRDVRPFPLRFGLELFLFLYCLYWHGRGWGAPRHVKDVFLFSCFRLLSAQSLCSEKVFLYCFVFKKSAFSSKMTFFEFFEIFLI